MRGRPTWLIGAAVVSVLIVGPTPDDVDASWPHDRREARVYEVGGLDPATLASIDRVVTVTGGEVTVVHQGTLRLMSVTRGDDDVQRPPAGMGYPMSVSAMDPEGISRFLGSDVRAMLGPGRIVMSERSAALRGARVGDTVEIEGWNDTVWTLEISGIVADADIEWAEIVMDTGVAVGLGLERPSLALIDGIDDESTARSMLNAIRSDLPIRVTFPGDPHDPTDDVLPTVAVKERFGEFAFVHDGPGDSITIDQEWVDANIVTLDIPRLGPFFCHRQLAPYVRSAMQELEATGLAGLIDSEDFQLAGGCWVPRLIRGGDRGFALSRHAWGAAFDVNPSTNRFGGETTLPVEFGEVFRSWGFAWGAGWLYPDGMHFEWKAIPEQPDRHACRVIERRLVGGDPAGWQFADDGAGCGT